MRTNKELVRRFREMHDITIPKGTRVDLVSGPGGGFAVRPELVQLNSATQSLFKHDSTYYYIWIEPEHVSDD